MAQQVMSFNVRIGDDDGIDIEAFKEAYGDNREEFIRGLIRKHLSGSEEQYYTIRGYSEDHKKYADIHNMDGLVNWHSDGIEYDTPEWRVIEHAVDLAERGAPGDKERSVALFQTLFGECNVFLKEQE